MSFLFADEDTKAQNLNSPIKSKFDWSLDSPTCQQVLKNLGLSKEDFETK